MPALVPQAPLTPTQIVPTPALAKKMKSAEEKGSQQWPGGPTEAIATPPRHEHDSMMSTWDKTERVRNGKVKAMAVPQGEDQDIQGGT